MNLFNCCSNLWKRQRREDSSAAEDKKQIADLTERLRSQNVQIEEDKRKVVEAELKVAEALKVAEDERRAKEEIELKRVEAERNRVEAERRAVEAERRAEEIERKRTTERWLSYRSLRMVTTVLNIATFSAMVHEALDEGLLNNFSRFLPVDISNVEPVRDWDRSSVGLALTMWGTRTGNQWAHLVPFTKSCAEHWIPLFIPFFSGLFGATADAAVWIMLFGWKTGTKRTGNSGLLFNSINYIGLPSQEVNLDADPAILIIPKVSNVKQILCWDEQSYECYVIAKDYDTWHQSGLPKEFIGNVREVDFATEQAEFSLALRVFNEFFHMLVNHLKNEPVEAGDQPKLKLCREFRSFLVRRQDRALPCLEHTNDCQDLFIVCVRFGGEYIKRPGVATPRNQLPPQRNNSHPMLLSCRACNAFLTKLNDERSWPEWEDFARTLPISLVPQDGIRTALILLPSCIDFTDNEFECLLCKSHMLVDGQYPNVPSHIKDTAMAIHNGCRQPSESEVAELQKFMLEHVEKAGSELDATADSASTEETVLLGETRGVK